MANKQFAVIGVGRFGYALAVELENSGYEVYAIDKNKERIEDIAPHVTHAVQADPSDEAVFDELGLENVDAILIGIGRDLPAAIMVCMLAKQNHVPYVLAKASEPIHGKILERIGADSVIFPEDDMGVRVAHRLISHNVLDYIELSDEYDMSNTLVPEQWIGKSISDLNIRAKYGLNIVAVRSGDNMTVSPGAKYVFIPHDVMIVIARTNDLVRFESTFQ